jgi:lambda family phage portal protein
MQWWKHVINYLSPGKFATEEVKSLEVAYPSESRGWSENEFIINHMLNHGKAPKYDDVIKRVYDAAIPTAATSDWLAWNTSGSYEALHGWRQICYKARDLERNNPHAVAFLRDLVTNVLGSNGIRFQPRVKNLKGGKLNDNVNKKLSDGWKDLRKLGNYDVTGQYSGVMADELILRALARDGGCLLRIYRGWKGNKHAFALQLLEIDTLDLWCNKILDNGNRITTGVETNEFGRPVAYHLLKYAQADLMANNTVGQRIVVPAKDIIHVWMPRRITEVRGISWFAQVLVKLRMLDKFEEAVGIGKRIEACKMGVLERDKDAPGRYTGQGMTPTGEIIEEMSPGQIIELPAGYRLNSMDPNVGIESYKDFKMETLRTVASGLGDQYNALANDLTSVNYSSARFGRDIVIEFWRGIQKFMVDYYLNRVAREWLECQSLYNTPYSVSMSDVDRIMDQCIWRPRGWPYIDPEKDVKGSFGSVSTGLSTRTRELAEKGEELEEVMEELAYEKDLAEKYGLTFTDPTGRNPNESTQEDPDSTPGDTEPDESGANK